MITLATQVVPSTAYGPTSESACLRRQYTVSSICVVWQKFGPTPGSQKFCDDSPNIAQLLIKRRREMHKKLHPSPLLGSYAYEKFPLTLIR